MVIQNQHPRFYSDANDTFARMPEMRNTPDGRMFPVSNFNRLCRDFTTIIGKYAESLFLSEVVREKVNLMSYEKLCRFCSMDQNELENTVLEAITKSNMDTLWYE